MSASRRATCSSDGARALRLSRADWVRLNGRLGLLELLSIADTNPSCLLLVSIQDRVVSTTACAPSASPSARST